MKKKLLLFLIILLILGGGYYYFFYQDKSFNFKRNIEEKLREQMKNVDAVKEKTLKELEKVKEEKIEDVQQKANELALNQKEKIVSNFKDKIGDLILNFSNSLDKIGVNLKAENKKEITLPASEKFYFPPPEASIILKNNTPFSLVIKGKVKYEIDWGDGENEKGELVEEEKDKVFIISHSFKEIGDYFVKVKIEKGGEFLNYNFPIRVY